eukprot:680396-Ditylum_brightwellii.AAC.1
MSDDLHNTWGQFLVPEHHTYTFSTPSWCIIQASELDIEHLPVASKDAWCPTPQRDHDKILMDMFEDRKPSKDTLGKLNAVRLYLGVVTLANIVNDLGTYIMAWAVTGASKAKPTLPWPNQGKLLDRCWTIWRRYLKECFAPDTSKCHLLHKPIKLPSLLRDWTATMPYTAREYYYDPVILLVLAYREGIFHEYRQTLHRFSLFQATNRTRSSLPDTATV